MTAVPAGAPATSRPPGARGTSHPAGGPAASQYVAPPPRADTHIDGVDVEAVAAAVLACPAVAALDGGRFGEVASYLPGRRVPGIAISEGRVSVQVRSRWVPAAELASEITSALAPLTGTRLVSVTIADIDVSESGAE
jgi:hypothetical protein